ncbi:MULTISPECIES: hypothetical protein [Actinoplanes]|uniref:hypothetical protein n=1 Tax=Actinoplanes TaxID=1865 RepID=UPI000A9604F9|nr:MULTISPECIES: hypothetical protein [Actinoplanes]GLX99990.1 hypothetical protein Acsp01_03700 [Actinoplanes sp. NBRC 101535]
MKTKDEAARERAQRFGTLPARILPEETSGDVDTRHHEELEVGFQNHTERMLHYAA